MPTNIDVRLPKGGLEKAADVLTTAVTIAAMYWLVAYSFPSLSLPQLWNGWIVVLISFVGVMMYGSIQNDWEKGRSRQYVMDMLDKEWDRFVPRTAIISVFLGMGGLLLVKDILMPFFKWLSS